MPEREVLSDRRTSPAPERITEYLCPRCGDAACPTPNSDHLESVYHRQPFEYVRADLHEAEVERLKKLLEDVEPFVGWLAQVPDLKARIRAELAPASDDSLAPSKEDA